MFGFFVAGASALGLMYMGRGGHRGRWARMGMHRVLSRLDASPAQERVIREALSRLREAGQDFAEEARASRSELGAIAEDAEFSEERLNAWLDEREKAFAALRPTLVQSFREIHEVLDTDQRHQLSRMIKRGPFGRRAGQHCHHYH